MATAKKKSEDIQVIEVRRGRVDVCVLGTSPLLCHRMPAKAWRELLLPAKRKSRVEKETSLKHDPYREFRDSVDMLKEGPTLLAIKASAFKGAMRGAAVDIPGTSKAAIGRLSYVEGDFVGIYGVPKLHMDIVRSADMNKTPDVRTRAIVPEWACKITITYTQPILKAGAVINLLAAGGIMQGVGDGRPEKGKLSFGCFELVEEKDPRFQAVLKSGGRTAQEEAMRVPECYDQQAAELLSWFDEEATAREFQTMREA